MALLDKIDEIFTKYENLDEQLVPAESVYVDLVKVVMVFAEFHALSVKKLMLERVLDETKRNARNKMKSIHKEFSNADSK